MIPSDVHESRFGNRDIARLARETTANSPPKPMKPQPITGPPASDVMPTMTQPTAARANTMMVSKEARNTMPLAQLVQANTPTFFMSWYRAVTTVVEDRKARLRVVSTWEPPQKV